MADVQQLQGGVKPQGMAKLAPVGQIQSPSANPIGSFGALAEDGSVTGNAALGVRKNRFGNVNFDTPMQAGSILSLPKPVGISDTLKTSAQQLSTSTPGTIAAGAAPQAAGPSKISAPATPKISPPAAPRVTAPPAPATPKTPTVTATPRTPPAASAAPAAPQFSWSNVSRVPQEIVGRAADPRVGDDNDYTTLLRNEPAFRRSLGLQNPTDVWNAAALKSLPQDWRQRASTYAQGLQRAFSAGQEAYTGGVAPDTHPADLPAMRDLLGIYSRSSVSPDDPAYRAYMASGQGEDPYTRMRQYVSSRRASAAVPEQTADAYNGTLGGLKALAESSARYVPAQTDQASPLTAAPQAAYAAAEGMGDLWSTRVHLPMALSDKLLGTSFMRPQDRTWSSLGRSVAGPLVKPIEQVLNVPVTADRVSVDGSAPDPSQLSRSGSDAFSEMGRQSLDDWWNPNSDPSQREFRDLARGVTYSALPYLAGGHLASKSLGKADIGSQFLGKYMPKGYFRASGALDRLTPYINNLGASGVNVAATGAALEPLAAQALRSTGADQPLQGVSQALTESSNDPSLSGLSRFVRGVGGSATDPRTVSNLMGLAAGTAGSRMLASRFPSTFGANTAGGKFLQDASVNTLPEAGLVAAGVAAPGVVSAINPTGAQPQPQPPVRPVGEVIQPELAESLASAEPEQAVSAVGERLSAVASESPEEFAALRANVQAAVESGDIDPEMKRKGQEALATAMKDQQPGISGGAPTEGDLAGSTAFADSATSGGESEPGSDFMTQVQQTWEDMPLWAKLSLGIGGGVGLVSALGAMASEEFNPLMWLLSALGLGAAGLGAASSGLFGEGAQSLVNSGMQAVTDWSGGRPLALAALDNRLTGIGWDDLDKMFEERRNEVAGGSWLGSAGEAFNRWSATPESAARMRQQVADEIRAKLQSPEYSSYSGLVNPYVDQIAEELLTRRGWKFGG